MLRALYHRSLSLSAHPQAEAILAFVAFLESSIFPVPPDAFLLPMGLAQPTRAYRYALVATLASVLGGLLGYALGYWFFATIGQWIISTYHLQAAMTTYQEEFARWGLLIILLKGLTPIPYKLVTIASGIAHFNIGVFILASLITRGGRFFLLAFLLRRFGDGARHFIDRNLPWVAGAFVLLLLGGFIIVFYIG